MNKVNFIGNVGNEPTITTLESGTVVMNFDIATKETFNDRNGEPQVKTQWHRIVAWNDCAKKIQEHLHKGNFVSIKAKAINRSYDKIIDIPVSKTKTIQHTEKVYVTEFRAFEVMIL